ncbi:MAG: hypothetical protein JW810_13575 [Sedimentisphaerales bacterium]|nr:hypothetical protein [Sedimentisphaerales bacterium]
MRRPGVRIVLVLLGSLATGMLPAALMAAPAEPNHLSPCLLAADPEANTLWIAQQTARRVDLFDTQTRRVVRRITLEARPNGMARDASGRLYIAAGAEEGCLYIVPGELAAPMRADPSRREAGVEPPVLSARQVAGVYPIGHTPTAPRISPDGRWIYLCRRFENDVVVFDRQAGEIAATIAVPREPIAAVLSSDGGRLFVANHLPEGPADGEYAAAEISVIDTAARTVCRQIPLPNGSTGVRDICLSADGTQAYVTHILARYQLPTTQLERGWMNTNALTILDAAECRRINTVLLDNVDQGAANPWAIACSGDGKWICVTHAGTNELSVIDRQRLQQRLRQAAAGELKGGVSRSAEDVPNDLAFLVGIRRRIPLAGIGPRALAVLGNRAWIGEYFSDSLAVVDLAGDDSLQPESIRLAPPPEWTVRRRGEMLFHDASLCFQGWQSCSSCHPDARSDGLNWDLMNDGIGNPKNTKSMLLAFQTPPAMALGVRGGAADAVRAGLRHILFSQRPPEDARAIDAYVQSLRPEVSPYRRDGRLTPAAQRGETLFQQAGCSSCHGGALLTDLKSYDVGTGRDRQRGDPVDTPTLVEVWRTGPYLLDGRAATIEQVLTQWNPEDRHGRTSPLSAEQVRDLAQYVLTR